ncbi:TIGR03618 family F420-dependent PPOX class oxidoreductase [Actinoallomurus rhizosphaericola]|uniref:TIGR03618 family F420-dependent PPOX class oxidoreductase n=1 Tax=Actinoallomurus rhizosphaericola TaxID=2952536 RepID=UPI0020905AEC|nr:TIGR03618 family F420-dependent PPOX class oxidoreductase [Actinoallomurus rhizosphaericola]MCO5993761.1 TIGR03618 family F420-dependent PPOX class oxidoreductase [Actinoallomurus rhizosphaericola]
MSDTENTPGSGPAPVGLSDEALVRFLADHRFGALATNKSSGHPHLSTVLYAWDERERVARISTTADRLKVRHLRKDPRSALYVASEDHWSFAVAEGTAELSPVTTTPGDPAGLELLAMVPPFENAGERAAFLEQMVADRRLVIRLRVDRLYGTALDVSSA